MGERDDTDESRRWLGAAIAKLDGVTARNMAIEKKLAAVYADLKTVDDELAELRASLTVIDERR